MDQRHQEYIEYYRARLARCQGKTLYPNTEAAERNMFEAISTAASLEEFRDRVHGQGLHVACAVARVKDTETAERDFWRQRGEVVRAAPHDEVLRALETERPQTANDVVSLVSRIHERWQLKISADEMLRDHMWNDFKIMEDIECYLQAQVPERWRDERRVSAKRDADAGVAHFRDHTLPETRKFVPDWQPDHSLLREPRHRRRFPVSDEVFEHRIESHKRYLGVS